LKNVLIVSFLFNQTENIGTVRLRGLAKYLPEFGWNPVVLTAKSSFPPIDKQITIFETPYTDTLVVWKKHLNLPINKTFKEHYNISTSQQKKTLIDKIIDLWQDIFIYPDQVINWSVSATEKGNEIFNQCQIDAIISSMSPATSHIVANELLKRKKVPWVADFRDLWTQNHFFYHSRIRLFFEQRLELKTLSLSNALTTVSSPLSEKLQELHKNKKVFTITNGFDPEQLNPGIPLTKKFSMTYTGILYRGHQNPEPFFRTMKVLIDEKMIDPSAIEIHFFGSDEGWLISDVKKYHLENIIQIHGQISREESIQKQRESHVLLLFTWNDPKEKGVYTGKIFDYLAAKRPILAIGLKGSVVADLLDQTQAGKNISTDAEIKDRILQLYREYQENGFVRYSVISSEIEKFNHREMAKKFAEVLDIVTDKKQNN
jgi:glycosyltransferase involved in cell wall biosynthesis